MFPLYIFSFIIHGVLSTTPCKDGVEIASMETKNPEDLLGNWTYVYHWYPKMKFIKDVPDIADPQSKCPLLHFGAITPELVKDKEDECAKFKMPFNWADAKLRVDAPALDIKAGVITIGEKENWMITDCMSMVRVVIKKVSDDFIVIVSPDNSRSELIIRGPPTFDELKCVARNVDVGKGMLGFGICYTNQMLRI